MNPAARNLCDGGRSRDVTDRAPAATVAAGGAATVRALKFNGVEYRRWHGRIARWQPPLLMLDAEFDQTVEHSILGTIARGTRSHEFYWMDRWYSVFRFIRAEGFLNCYYCNLNAPPSFDGKTLSFVDLDIDVLVAPDLSYRILDADEFEIHASKLGYPAEVRDSVRSALDQLLRLIQSGQFPFDCDPLTKLLDARLEL